MGIPIGQNLAFGYDNWDQVIKEAWYDEVKDFSYGSGSTGGVTSHFVMVCRVTKLHSMEPLTQGLSRGGSI